MFKRYSTGSGGWRGKNELEAPGPSVYLICYFAPTDAQNPQVPGVRSGCCALSVRKRTATTTPGGTGSDTFTFGNLVNIIYLSVQVNVLPV